MLKRALCIMQLKIILLENIIAYYMAVVFLYLQRIMKSKLIRLIGLSALKKSQSSGFFLYTKNISGFFRVSSRNSSEVGF